jgi:hypothetical protein
VLPVPELPRLSITACLLGCASAQGEVQHWLRSVALNAPWVHHVYILVNTGQMSAPEVAAPDWIPHSMRGKTSIIDRCKHMPPGSCPSANSHQVQAFAHRIPGLMEHMIIAEDDIFLGRNTPPSFFFERTLGWRPVVGKRDLAWECSYRGCCDPDDGCGMPHRLYNNTNAVDFPTPLSMSPSPHWWYPMLKSVAADLERQYPEYFRFLATHTEGRYSSVHNSSTSAAAKDENSQEEVSNLVSHQPPFRTLTLR